MALPKILFVNSRIEIIRQRQNKSVILDLMKIYLCYVAAFVLGLKVGKE